jgi:hypothetical protein
MKHHFTCQVCKKDRSIEDRFFPINCCGVAYSVADGVVTACGRRVPNGPGTQMSMLLARLGIRKQQGCGCEETALEMNMLGCDGCRQHRDELLERLRAGYKTASLLTKGAAFVHANRQGLPTTLEGLLDLAIELAEAECQDPAAESGGDAGGAAQ